jgi:alkylated DNA nucleotide flippase Atl1
MGRMSEEYDPGAPTEYAERVLDTVDLIPPGRVMTYGDVAEWLRGQPLDEEPAPAGRPGSGSGRPNDRFGPDGRSGAGGPGDRSARGGGRSGRQEGGPRQVGRVMALYGGGVPWWRVVRSDGALLPGHELEALARYRAEGTPLRLSGPAGEGHLPRLDMRRARWDGTDPVGQGAAGKAAEGPAHEGPAQAGPGHDRPGHDGADHDGPAREGSAHDGPVREAPAHGRTARDAPARGGSRRGGARRGPGGARGGG